MSRLFVKLTSDCDVFNADINPVENKIELTWNSSLSLKDVKTIGLYEIKIYRIGKLPNKDGVIDTRIYCNLLQRTSTNPNKEIANIHWWNDSDYNLMMTKNLGILICNWP